MRKTANAYCNASNKLPGHCEILKLRYSFEFRMSTHDHGLELERRRRNAFPTHMAVQCANPMTRMTHWPKTPLQLDS